MAWRTIGGASRSSTATASRSCRPRTVRPYVRRNKTDRADAEAILEAVRSGEMPSVPVKRVEQQALVGLHRVREQWMTTRTARINTLREILREHGLLLPAGPRAALQAVPALLEEAETGPADALAPRPRKRARGSSCASRSASRIWNASCAPSPPADPVVMRLQTIPGSGLLTATALVGSVGHIHAFRRARQFASWLGLTPREHSSGARRHLGRISKRGDVYLRCLLTHGARAILVAAQRRRASAQPLTRLHSWAMTVRDRRGHNKATIAVANWTDGLGVWHHDVSFALPDAAHRNGDVFHRRCSASDETYCPSVRPRPHQADSSPGA